MAHVLLRGFRAMKIAIRINGLGRRRTKPALDKIRVDARILNRQQSVAQDNHDRLSAADNVRHGPKSKA